MKTLIVAEKPSVARDIAKVLKVSGKGEGCLIGEKYVISWAIGHLITLCDPEDYNPALKRWKGADLPIIPAEIRLKPIAKTNSQLKVLRKWMNAKEVSDIVCATDAGREGELIFRYIYDFVKCRKPARRLWIFSMTDAAIREGFANLRPGADFDNLYFSARCRSHADWLVGINASRAYSISHNAHLSIGRVQTPTLAMIVARQKEIDNFVPKDYWEVEADFLAKAGAYGGKWFSEKLPDGRILDKEQAQGIVAKVKGKTGEVLTANTEEKRQPPPLLHDLAELQRECNRKYGYTAAKTLNYAQNLYEKHKLITYPRTDSRHLSKDLAPKLEGIVDVLAKLPEYETYAKFIQNMPNLPITNRIVNDSKVTDHHAIIPTESRKRLASLSAEERNVYDAIVRRFLAVFYPENIRDITTVISIVENESFVSKGVLIRRAGWRELYSDEKDEDDEKTLPPLEAKEAVRVTKTAAKAKKTQPPKPYTEATLLSAMENAGKMIEDEEIARQMKDSGLGTAATRAAIIERLLTVGYISRRGKALLPTDKAKSLIQILPAEITSPETTGRWEKGLVSISEGGLTADRFMGSIEKFVRFLVENAQNSPKDVVFEKEPAKTRGRGTKKSANSLGNCPLCSGDVLENTKAFYCGKWKNGCKFNIWKSTTKNYHYDLTSEDVATLLSGAVVKNIRITMPDTAEIAAADLILDTAAPSVVRFVNTSILPVSQK